MLALLSAGAWSPLSLAVSRGLAGGFFGAAYPSTLIYVGDTVAASQRQRDIARLMVGVAAGTALASVGAGVLADVASWRAAFVITGVASLVLALWTLRRLPEPDATLRPTSARQAIGTLRRSPVALLVLLFAFVEGAVLLGALTLLPPAVERRRRHCRGRRCGHRGLRRLGLLSGPGWSAGWRRPGTRRG